MSISIVIKNSDAVIPNFIPDFIGIIFTKDGNENKFFYDISVGFIVSFIFYITVSFIPDCLDTREKFNSQVDIRIAVHRDVQLFVANFISAIREILKNRSDKTDNLYFQNLKNDILVQAYENTIINDESPMTDGNKKLTWELYIRNYSKMLNEYGERILSRHKGDLNSKIYTSIHYLVYDSQLINLQIKFFSLPANMRPKSLILPRTLNGEINMNEKSIQHIINASTWVNDEHDKLTQLSKDCVNTIYKIDISTKID